MSNDLALLLGISLFRSILSIMVPVIVYWWVKRAIFD